MHVLSFKRYCTTKHSIEKHTEAPCIGCKPFITAVRDNLWSNISGCPALLSNALILLYDSADSKVANLDLSIVIQKDIVKFNVSMEN
jgi:hypothetical protein